MASYLTYTRSDWDSDEVAGYIAVHTTGTDAIYRSHIPLYVLCIATGQV